MGAKAKSGLNRKGILLLADDLVAHKKMYDQDELSSVGECGTVCCLAGFCFRRKIGPRMFNKWAKEDDSGRHLYTANEAFDAGGEQLGVGWRGGNIFAGISNWPDDLENEYYENGPRGRVVVALKALQRLRSDGTIDPDPKKIHTRLPQLKALLATKKKAKTA